MGAETNGRKLGIGVRLFAKAARQGVAAAASASSPPRAADSSTPTQPSSPRRGSGQPTSFAAAQAARQVGAKAGGVAKGAKRFGQAMVGPMVHTGSVLWLEITGLFFGLFALFFAQNVYKFRQDYAGGPEHVHFLVYAALTVLFTGFTITQFYKARSKEKRNRARLANSIR